MYAPAPCTVRPSKRKTSYSPVHLYCRYGTEGMLLERRIQTYKIGAAPDYGVRWIGVISRCRSPRRPCNIFFCFVLCCVCHGFAALMVMATLSAFTGWDICARDVFSWVCFLLAGAHFFYTEQGNSLVRRVCPRSCRMSVYACWHL